MQLALDHWSYSRPKRDDNGSELPDETADPGDRAGGVGELGPHKRGFGGAAPKARQPEWACFHQQHPMLLAFQGVSQFRKCHFERSDSEVKNPDLARGLRSFAKLRLAQDDKSGMHPLFTTLNQQGAELISNSGRLRSRAESELH